MTLPESLSEDALSKIVAEAVAREVERRGDAEHPIAHPRDQIVRMCRRMYTRHLSDSAGGNVSLRVGDNVYITPRYMGEHHQWEIGPDDIILARTDGAVLEGRSERISREGSVHFGIYGQFPEIGAVIHAHPAYCLVFACSGREMPSVTAMAEHFEVGTVPLVEDAPPGTKEMAGHVLDVLKRRRQEGKALVVMMPRHGVAVAGKDLNEAYVILETVETNARVSLMSRLLERHP